MIKHIIIEILALLPTIAKLALDSSDFMSKFIEIRGAKKIKLTWPQAILVFLVLTFLNFAVSNWMIEKLRSKLESPQTSIAATESATEGPEKEEPSAEQTEQMRVYTGHSVKKITKEGKLTQDEPNVEIEFHPSNPGVHKIELKTSKNVVLSIEDSNGTKVTSERISGDEGFSINLGNKTYKIRLENDGEDSSYSMTIWKKKDAWNIEDYDQVNDRIEYEGQENDYRFWAPQVGRYSFTLSTAYDVCFHVYDQGMTELEPLKDSGNTTKMSFDFQRGKMYTLSVSAPQKDVDYTIDIEKVKTFTGKEVIRGELTEINQEDSYSYIPLHDDIYRVRLNSENKELDVNVSVFLDNGQLWDEFNILQKQDGSLYFYKNQVYNFKIAQHYGLGEYALEIVSHNDSGAGTILSAGGTSLGYFDFEGQERVFKYTPELSGTYYVDFTEIDEDLVFDVEVESSGGQNQVARTIEAPKGTIEMDMIAGEEYKVQVKQKQNFGEYLITFSER